MAQTRCDFRARRLMNLVFPQGAADYSVDQDIGTAADTHRKSPSHKRRSSVVSSNSSKDTRDEKLQLGQSRKQNSDQARWDQSWSIATGFLSLPEDGFDEFVRLPSTLQYRQSITEAELDALKLILEPTNRLPDSIVAKDWVSWYSKQIRTHFLGRVLPEFNCLRGRLAGKSLIHAAIGLLKNAQRLYLSRVNLVVEKLRFINPDTIEQTGKLLRRDLHTIVADTVMPQIFEPLNFVLCQYVPVILGIPIAGPSAQKELPLKHDETKRESARLDFLELVTALQNIGLGGELFQSMFAELMSQMLDSYVFSSFKGDWLTQHAEKLDHSVLPRKANHVSTSRCIVRICEWAENHFSRLVHETCARLDSVPVKWTDVERWKELGISRLIELRTEELYDIVVAWPESQGALDDIRTSITTPQTRLGLTEIFKNSLKGRLLHPGTSTLEILRVYISMILSFHSLDNTKVLLDRVAYPLQVYLCSREDTVKIIITGFLAELEDELGNQIKPGGEKLAELAVLLESDGDQNGRAADELLDWNDPDWVPDPVDAGPGYKRPKSADVIGDLIESLGPTEVFIREFQNIVGENLLRSDGNFEKEKKLLELLKKRFGEGPLQNCEVMLKDIEDSKRLFSAVKVHRNLEDGSPKTPDERRAHDTKAGFRAKILSRLFWPQLHEEDFVIPDEIRHLQRQYEASFESIKASRKLNWLPALGHVKVRLDLQDRVVSEDVHTWQATVIWAFQENEMDDGPVTRTVPELGEKLQMNEALLRSALTFWVSKLVIHETSRDAFAVLETLNSEDREKSSAQAAAAAETIDNDTTADAALVASTDESGEQMIMYWQFIQGMLTNSSKQMALGQIAMMLKMLIADGFPYSNEELQEFLGTKVSNGELELAGGKYQLSK